MRVVRRPKLSELEDDQRISGRAAWASGTMRKIEFDVEATLEAPTKIAARERRPRLGDIDAEPATERKLSRALIEELRESVRKREAAREEQRARGAKVVASGPPRIEIIDLEDIESVMAQVANTPMNAIEARVVAEEVRAASREPSREAPTEVRTARPAPASRLRRSSRALKVLVAGAALVAAGIGGAHHHAETIARSQVTTPRHPPVVEQDRVTFSPIARTAALRTTASVPVPTPPAVLSNRAVAPAARVAAALPASSARRPPKLETARVESDPELGESQRLARAASEEVESALH